MRTRCKFRVVGIEQVDHAIHRRAWKANTPEAEYAAIESQEWTEIYGENRGLLYKNVFVANAQNIRLAAQYDPTIPEDQRFMEATPTGELKFYVSNPAVIGGFEIGTNYYVDLTPCE
jgi:hypothetical protein